MKKSETKAEARAAGLRFYNNGIPCKLGHIPPVRYVTTGKCLACCRAEGTRYKEKRAAHAAKNMAAMVAKTMAWRKANPEKTAANRAVYRERHREKLRLKSVEYRKFHPTDPVIRSVREARRRAKKTGNGGAYTKDDVERLNALRHGKCAYCRTSLKKSRCVDHIMPIVLNGHSNPSNLQLLCKSCNSSKGGQHPITFAQRIGLLL